MPPQAAGHSEPHDLTPARRLLSPVHMAWRSVARVRVCDMRATTTSRRLSASGDGRMRPLSSISRAQGTEAVRRLRTASAQEGDQVGGGVPFPVSRRLCLPQGSVYVTTSRGRSSHVANSDERNESSPPTALFWRSSQPLFDAG